MALTDKGILEALLYTAGDEGLETKQLVKFWKLQKISQQR